MRHLLSGVYADHASLQLVFPNGMVLGFQIGHGEHAVGGVFTQQRRNRVGQVLCGKAQPCHLVSVALDRCFPQRRYFQLWQSTFKAKALPWRVHPHDEGGNAAGQRCERDLFMGQQQAHALQGWQHRCELLRHGWMAW